MGRYRSDSLRSLRWACLRSRRLAAAAGGCTFGDASWRRGFGDDIALRFARPRCTVRAARPMLHADRCSCSAAGAGDADAEDANAPSDGRMADAEVRILRKLARSQVRSYGLNPPLPCAPAALSWCSAALAMQSTARALEPSSSEALMKIALMKM